LVAKYLTKGKYEEVENLIIEEKRKYLLRQGISNIKNNNDIIRSHLMIIEKQNNIFYQNINKIRKNSIDFPVHVVFHQMREYYAYFLWISGKPAKLSYFGLAP